MTKYTLNPLDQKAKLKALRESWANTCNTRLPETARIDHRSLADQGGDLEPTSGDVLTAFRSVMRDARRGNGTWVAIGLDGRGRDVEMVYKQVGDSVLIYHAMTPPTKKTLKEIGRLNHERSER